MLDAGSVKALPLPPCALGFRSEMSPQVEMLGLRGLKFLRIQPQGAAVGQGRAWSISPSHGWDKQHRGLEGLQS